jgi:hypothetical protein
MADEPNPPDPVEAAISAASAAGRKRRPPTLDLTATDTTPAAPPAENPPPPDAVIESPIAAEAATVPPAEAATPESSPSSFAPDPASPDAVAPEPFAAGDQLPPPPPPSSESVPPHRSSFGGAFAAGALGAVLMLLVLGMLWVTGVFGGWGDSSLLADRTTRLETQLRALNDRPGAMPGAPAFDAGKLDDLTRRLAALETRPAPTSGASTPAPDAALAGRIATLEGTIKTLSVRLDATANTAREAAQQSAAPAASPAELEALTARVSTVERAAKAIQDDVAKRFSAGLADPAARRAVAAEALRAAVERGEPFAAQLKAAGNANALAPLRPFADSGVPAAAVLARELNALLPSLRSAQPSAQNTDTGFMQKLQANAEKLVRVRPVNEVAGDDPAATLSRVEARARNADIDGALAELGKLPADARAPAEAWMRKAQARRDAVQAARQFAADSLNQLADSSGTR